MSFDIQPMVSLKEKKAFLKEAYDHQYILFFEHDRYVECGILTHTERGYKLGTPFLLQDI
jgi:hypothetical protein